MSSIVSLLLRQAEEILETAIPGTQEIAIVIGRDGSLRMIQPAGWSLAAMRAEFGAASVFKVERSGRTVRVEGWDGFQSCRLERPALHHPLESGNFARCRQNLLAGRAPAGLLAGPGEFESHDFAVLRHPYAADQPEYGCVVGTLDGNPRLLFA
jgi:hypothetical protein